MTAPPATAHGPEPWDPFHVRERGRDARAGRARLSAPPPPAAPAATGWDPFRGPQRDHVAEALARLDLDHHDPEPAGDGHDTEETDQ